MAISNLKSLAKALRFMILESITVQKEIFKLVKSNS